MAYQPRTSNEINIHKIDTLMKKVRKGSMAKTEATKELNQRFTRLQGENIGMYEEMYPKYLTLMRY
jgi:hypothetical protein